MATVLIASAEHLSSFKERGDFGEAQLFSDAEALRALEVITRQRPSLVALERLFAATSRGVALINRIKADPALSGCEIRIVGHDGPATAPSLATPAGTPPATRTGDTAAADGAAPMAATPLDLLGTRRTQRRAVPGSIEVLIDGNPVSLVDVSEIGAQVVSASIIKPNQRVRVTLPDSGGPVRVNATVTWALFEMPKEGPRYRAGIEFFDAAPAIARWLANLDAPDG